MLNCHLVTLARNEVAEVQQCTQCSCLSIHIGPTTMRIDSSALDALAKVLGEASLANQAAQTGAFSGARRGLA